jgi:hypothetical protein
MIIRFGYTRSKFRGFSGPKEKKMAKKGLLGGILGLAVVFFAASCVSVGVGHLSPNASQSVINVRRSSSATEKGKKMEVYIDGRIQKNTVENGGEGSFLTMNGLHNIHVKIKKHQSQMLTFDCSSEVVEFLVNFEGSEGFLGIGNTLQLNLTKISGGDGNKNVPNNATMPSITVNVDNSSSNTASSSGNTSTNNNSQNVGDDNSIR